MNDDSALHPGGDPPPRDTSPPRASEGRPGLGADDDLGRLVESDPSQTPTTALPHAPRGPVGPGGVAPRPPGESSRPPEVPLRASPSAPHGPNVPMRVALAVAAALLIVGSLIGGYVWGSASQDPTELSNQLARAEGRIADLQGNVDDLTKRGDDLQSQVQDLRAQNEQLSQQVTDLQSRNDRLRSQNERLQAQTGALVGANPDDGPSSVGGTLLINGAGDEQLNVTLIQVFDPSASGTPSPGNRLVAVQLHITNLGPDRYQDELSGGAVLTAGGSPISPAPDGMEPSLATVGIDPGASLSGFLTFEVPEGAGLESFALTLDSGAGPQTGRWNLG